MTATRSTSDICRDGDRDDDEHDNDHKDHYEPPGRQAQSGAGPIATLRVGRPNDHPRWLLRPGLVHADPAPGSSAADALGGVAAIRDSVSYNHPANV